MTDRRRFCVLFANEEGPGPRQKIKMRLLHSDSTREDLIQIWKQVYQEEDPAGAEIYLNENCAYRLDDDDDIAAFLVQAEDQYNLLPSYPLHVKLVDSRRREKHKDIKSEFGNHCGLLKPEEMQEGVWQKGNPAINIIPQRNVNPIRSKASGDKALNRLQANLNNNNDRSVKDENLPPSPESSSALSPARSLLMLSQCRPQSSTESLQAPDVASCDITNSQKDILTNGSTESFSTFENDSGAGLSKSGGMSVGKVSPVTYSKPSTSTSLVPSFSSVRNEKGGLLNSDTANCYPPQLDRSLPSAYSALYKNFQEQRWAQSNRNAYLFWQALVNNQIWANAQRHDLGRTYATPSLPPVSDSFVTAQHSLLPKGSSFHETGMIESSLMPAASDYNRNSILNNYMNASVLQAMQNYTEVEEPESLSKKLHKKRKRSARAVGDGKSLMGAKRMRSTVSKSNIETHYQLAVAYSQMPEDEKKQQNSAHRSHWKHLLFVAKVSPGFVQKFKYAKYDEWSSETRDIYAMCLPDQYMWPFLTLSKQGHLLCQRIIGRIDGLLEQNPEERPDWCPKEETLNKARLKATERLEQLRRILQSRSANQKTESWKNKSRELKPSVKEQRAALMRAYLQQQHISSQQGTAELPNSTEESTQLISMPTPTVIAGANGIECSSGASSKSLTPPRTGCSSTVMALPQIGCSPGASSNYSASPRIVCPSDPFSRSAAPLLGSDSCSAAAAADCSKSSSSVGEQREEGHSNPRPCRPRSTSLVVTV